MEGGVFAALARGALQGLERLGGGDIPGLPRLSRREATSSSARLVEIEALGPKTAPSPAQLSAQARALREERAVAGIVRVVEAALRPDPVLGDAGENLEAERRALARLRRGVARWTRQAATGSRGSSPFAQARPVPGSALSRRRSRAVGVSRRAWTDVTGKLIY